MSSFQVVKHGGEVLQAEEVAGIGPVVTRAVVLEAAVRSVREVDHAHVDSGGAGRLLERRAGRVLLTDVTHRVLARRAARLLLLLLVVVLGRRGRWWCRRRLRAGRRLALLAAAARRAVVHD